MSITLKIVNTNGETREVVVNEGETIELQTGEKIDVTITNGNNLELILVGNNLIVGDGVIEILVTNFIGSGGLVSGGDVITAQQVASGQFSRVEIAETIIEAEATEITTTEQPTQQPVIEVVETNEFYDPRVDVDGLSDSNDITAPTLNAEDSTDSRLGNTDQIIEDPIQPGESTVEVVVEALEPVSVFEGDLTYIPTISWLQDGMEGGASIEAVSLNTVFGTTQGTLQDNGIYTLQLGGFSVGTLEFHPNGDVQWLPSDDFLQENSWFDQMTVTHMVEYTVSNGDATDSYQLNLTFDQDNGVPVIVEVESSPALVSGEVTYDEEDGFSNDSWEFSHEGGYLGIDIATDLTEEQGTLLDSSLTLLKFEGGEWQEIAFTDYGGSFSPGFDETGSGNHDDVFLQLLDLDSGNYRVEVNDRYAAWPSDGGGKYQLSFHGDVTDITLVEGGSNDVASVDIGSGNVTESIVHIGKELLVGGYQAGKWTTENSSENAKIISFTMSYNGQEYTQGVEDLQEGGFYQIAIIDPTTDVTLGDLIFLANGNIEFKPTEAINSLADGESISADFSFSIEDNGIQRIHTQSITFEGENDSPTVNFYDNDRDDLLGGVAIEDADNDSMISKASVTIKEGKAGDYLSVGDLEGTGLTVDYINGQLTLSGLATTDVYEEVLATLTHSSTEDFTVAGDRKLEVIVYDDQGAASNPDTAYIYVDSSALTFNEDDLVVLADAQEASLPGNWQPQGSSDAAKLTYVSVRINSNNYSGVSIENSDDFKIQIGSAEAGASIPVLGEIILRANGQIEFIPTDGINFLTAEATLDAYLSYNVQDNGEDTYHNINLSITGENDIPVIQFIESDSLDEPSGLFGEIEISDIDASAWVQKIKVSVQEGLSGELGINQQDLREGLDVNYDEDGTLIISGTGTAEEYEALLASVYFIPTDVVEGQNTVTLSVTVQDDAREWSESADKTVSIQLLEPVNVQEDELLSSSSLNWLKEGMAEDASLQGVSLNFSGSNIQGVQADDIYSINIDQFGFLNFYPDGDVKWLPTELIQNVELPESITFTLIADYKVSNDDNLHQLNLTIAKEGDTLVITEVDTLPAVVSGEIIGDSGDGFSTDSWAFSHEGGYLGLDLNTIETVDGYGSDVTRLDADLALFKLEDGAWEEIAYVDYGMGASKGFDGSESGSDAYLQILDLENGDYKVHVIQGDNNTFASGGEYTLSLHGDVKDISLAEGDPGDVGSVQIATGSVTEDIVYIEEENTVGSYPAGQWKAEGSSESAKLVSFTMSYNGQEYTQDLDDLQEGGFYQIAIFEPTTEVKLGDLLFYQNGQIELKPTDAVIAMNADQSFSADFTYVVEDSGNTGIYNQTITLEGENDAPVVSFSRSQVSIEDSDSGSMVTKAVVNLIQGDPVNTYAVNSSREGNDSPDVTLGIDIDEQGYVRGTEIKATLTENKLILEGTATASDYESVLENIYFTKVGEEYYQYFLDVVVTDDQDQESELARRFIDTGRRHYFSEDEDTLASLLTDESGSGSYSLGEWKNSYSEAELSGIVMQFNGKDYVYDSVDFTNNEFLKVTLQDPDGEPVIPEIGSIFFYSDGRVEFVPTESINALPEGTVLDTRFSMSYAGASKIFVETIDFEITGKNDAPIVELRMDDETTEGIQTGLFGKINFSEPDVIGVDPSAIKSMKVWIASWNTGDQLNVDLMADTGSDNSLNLEYVFQYGTLSITGEGTLEDYEAALSRVYLIPNASSEPRLLVVEVTDVYDATGEDRVFINVANKSTITAVEADVVPFIGETQPLPDETPQDTFNVGTWKAPEVGGKITSLFMSFAGTELVRDIQDYSESEGFKITIANEANGIPDIGTIYFTPSGTIEFEPTEAVNIIPEGIWMSSEFTYTVDSGTDTTVHTVDMVLNGSDSDYDVLFLDSGALGSSLSDLVTFVNNVEEVTLKNQMLSFTIDDVISITDEDNTLFISEAEAGSYVFDDANWSNNGSVTVDDVSYTHWSATKDDSVVTLYIDNNLDIAGP